MKQSQALDILKTGANVFLTGEPGSGKTHTINQYVDYLKAAKIPVAVTASTGIAATHIGGMTIHSWSGIGIKKRLSEFEVDRIASTERIARRINRTAVLIIDEVSMLDGAILKSVDEVCRAVRQDGHPFGGMQVVLVGDFFQLPPVSREGEDAARFAFAAPVWNELNPLVCYLSEQHRQEDEDLLRMLTSLRHATITDEMKKLLDARMVEMDESIEHDFTRLHSHNVDVDRVNEAQLVQIEGKSKAFTMKETGRKGLVEQLKRGCLSPERLMLKVGAVVMFTKNDPKREFANGTMGVVTGWDTYTSLPEVTTRNGRVIQTEPMEWTVEDNGRVMARVAQVPLRLAWAMTVHKSQGMSLDAAQVDLRQAFEAGQGYVALSRVRTFKGLFLTGYNEQALQVHPEVLEKDEDFRLRSDESVAVFDKLSLKELRVLHRNFVKACGGTMPRTGDVKAAGKKNGGSKAFSVKILRRKYPNAYRAWEKKEDKALATSWRKGKKTSEIAAALGRQPGAIRSRLRKLGLVEA